MDDGEDGFTSASENCKEINIDVSGIALKIKPVPGTGFIF